MKRAIVIEEHEALLVLEAVQAQIRLLNEAKSIMDDHHTKAYIFIDSKIGRLRALENEMEKVTKR